jgi:hypothetical protein
MHISFDESIPSKEDIVVCDDDNDILEVHMKDVTKVNNDDQSKHKEESIQ